MKKLYQTFFYVPKYGKVQDRVMTARAVVSLSVILLCLASMAVTAYAWFSYNISSATNRLTAARFGTELGVTRSDGAETVVSPRSDGSRLLKLSGGQTYEVTITLSQDSTANTGFCILTVEGGDTWHTWQLGMDGDVQRNHLTFWLQPSEDMDIIIRDCWGTSSSYGDPNATNRIGEGQTLTLPPASAAPDYAVPPTKVPATTVPPTTVPPTTVPHTTVPPTTVPATTVPPTTVPPTTVPATTVPPTTVPATTVPATTVPPTTVPPTTVPPTTVPTTVPTTTVPPTTAFEGTEVTYVIQEGDALTVIAEQYGISVEELCRINGIEDPDLIYVGEVIRIPVAQSL